MEPVFKDARINIKLASKDKSLIESAAAAGGFRSTTDYMMKVLLEDSRKRLEAITQIIESEEEARLFYEILNSPVPESHELDKSAIRYKEIFG